MNLKMKSYLLVNLFGTALVLWNRIYQAAVSKSLSNTALNVQMFD